jgi:hypothetical protein
MPRTSISVAMAFAMSMAIPGLASAQGDEQPDSAVASEPAPESSDSMLTVRADIWADNWLALNVNGELADEDSVPITTERSFNAETFTFEASYPLTIAIETKDFKETDSGIEYVGQPRQQMGDGGIIAQFVDAATGEVVGPKDGYDEIEWDAAAQLVWGPDLELDNTVLLRTTLER